MCSNRGKSRAYRRYRGDLARALRTVCRQPQEKDREKNRAYGRKKQITYIGERPEGSSANVIKKIFTRIIGGKKKVVSRRVKGRCAAGVRYIYIYTYIYMGTVWVDMNGYSILYHFFFTSGTGGRLAPPIGWSDSGLRIWCTRGYVPRNGVK